eukprot:11017243-Lingulodinium_polyedra.AAC.1
MGRVGVEHEEARNGALSVPVRCTRKHFPQGGSEFHAVRKMRKCVTAFHSAEAARRTRRSHSPCREQA